MTVMPAPRLLAHSNRTLGAFMTCWAMSTNGVEDCWEISYGDAPRDGSAVEKKEPCFRVVRGGDWFSGSERAGSFKVTRRTNNYPMRVITHTGPNYGVRLAKSVAEAR